MQVEHLHVAALVEDFLRAVAVMVVDIEDGDARRALVAEPLGDDRGVVDVAVAAHEGRAGVMARRAAEREGGPFASLDESGGGQRDIIGRLDRVPCAFDEARAAVEGIEAEQRVDGLRAHVRRAGRASAR